MLLALLMGAMLAPALQASPGPPDPANAVLESAYAALRAGDYDSAAAFFREALRVAPGRAAVRKDLAYTYLKIGENEAARDEFAEAVKLAPDDEHAALEYAFLCHETKRTREARLVFDRLRQSPDAAIRATAEQAFQNVDRPLAEGIERWSKVVAQSPDNFSAHRELAELAQLRGQTALAAEHFEKAWRLRPGQRSLLLELGRAWKDLGREEQARAALLAASRGAEPRTAEQARELLPGRYPYVNEFRAALDLDSRNIPLRRELAYLLLEMGQQADAEREFQIITQLDEADLLSAAQLGFLMLARQETAGALPLLEKVLGGDDEELADRVRTMLKMPQTLRRRPETPRARVSLEAKSLAEKSYQAGYLKDALKYFQVAHDTDPVDFAVMLKLGWVQNILKDDREAVRWFDMARRSTDPAVAGPAEKAYRNLQSSLGRIRTTGWIFPIYSSRWRDLFSYGQFKTELRLGRFPAVPYVSLRFIGDTRRTTGEASPQYLSESAVIAGAGLATKSWNGLTAWGEAGSAVSYLWARKDVQRVAPDYRGGVSFSRGFGRLLGGESSGLFLETSADAVYLSRFQGDIVFYSQSRLGWTLPTLARAGGFEWQLFWNYHLTADSQRQAWANFLESGPGLRFRWRRMPRSVSFSVSALRGSYTIREGNPHPPVFYDLRAGVWYAFTR